MKKLNLKILLINYNNNEKAKTKKQKTETKIFDEIQQRKTQNKKPKTPKYC